MNHLEHFNQYKEYLFSIAYRMLSSVMDAEDILQETYLKWQKVDLKSVKSQKYYLSTIVTRLCIDFLRSKKIQREEYIGPYLPEPLVLENYNNLEFMMEKAESVSIAFMLLLEKLSPVERAVFLLHNVFDYNYAEISEVVNKTETNCRQILHRAEEHINSNKKRFSSTKEQKEKIVQQFFNACQKSDLDGLISILSEDVVLISDGGGKATAVKYPLISPDKVARFFIGLTKKAPKDYVVKLTNINGLPGFIGYLNNKPFNVVIFEIDNEKITNFYAILNPDKLINIPII